MPHFLAGEIFSFFYQSILFASGKLAIRLSGWARGPCGHADTDILVDMAVLEPVEAAHFSMYCSDAVFVRAASLSRWETR